jgi:hypothetical protein
LHPHRFRAVTAPFALAVLVACLPAVPASAQRVVAVGDEWPLTNDAFSANTTSAAAFALNVGQFFGGSGNRFLVSSSNGGLTGSSLAATMTSAGYTWDINAGASLSLANLQAYDAVFFAGAPNNSINFAALQQYVSGGGSVFIAAGTGAFGTAGSEANFWNPFLSAFGLQFGNTWFPDTTLRNIPLEASTNPLRTGANFLRWGFGQTASEIIAADQRTDALIGDFGTLGGRQSVVAVFDGSATAVPEPGTATSTAAGVLVAAVHGFRLRGRRRRRS